MTITIKSYKDSLDVARSTAKEINILLESAQDHPVLLLVSGGSARDVLAFIDVRTFGVSVTVSTVDERYGVSKEQQNFYQLKQTAFARRAIAAGGKFCDPRTADASDVAEAGVFLDECFRRFLQQYSDGRIITLLGIGQDGHTAGVMPFPEDPTSFRALFLDADTYAVGYDAQDRNPLPLRATATLAFLRDHVDTAVIYATGSDKAGALHAIMDKKDQLHHVPARILHAMKNVTVFTDQRVL